jgi:hypothetical protein
VNRVGADVDRGQLHGSARYQSSVQRGDFLGKSACVAHRSALGCVS